MRILRLAQLFEQKYGLVSQSQSIDVPGLAKIVGSIRAELSNAYRMWMSPEGKDESLVFWAQRGHAPSKELVVLMKDLSENKDYSPVQLFNRVNAAFKLSKLIASDLGHFKDQLKDNTTGLTHPLVNELNHRESKARTSLRHLESILERQGKILLRLQPKGQLAEQYEEQKRKPLPRQKLWMFMHSRAAQTYGLDNMYVVEQVLFYPETKEMLTTLINAIDRGHMPIDGPAMMAETAKIKEWLDNKQQTNVPALEQAPEKQPPAVSLFEEEEK
jgi:hypothetical protein